jgi:hypothetical protein
MTIRSLSTTLAFSMITLAAGAFAQPAIGTSTLCGNVLDPSGALIPHAQVTVSNADGYSRTLQSDDSGSFDLESLPAGTYSLGISAPGFTPSLENVEVGEGETTVQDVKLGISVNQQIEVFAR